MKNLFIIILCLAGSKVFSQTNELMVEEKSSEWIKITAPPTVTKPRTSTTIKKNTNANKPVTPKPDAEEFEKTNKQVNRFKKTKKG